MVRARVTNVMRVYTYRESVQAYWFLRQLRNRLRAEHGCPNCLRYLNEKIHRSSKMLGVLWAEVRLKQELNPSTKKEVA